MPARLSFFIICLLILFSCQNSKQGQGPDLNISFEKYELDNGLDVVFHIDRSDPVVAVALTAHVGSAREKQGRTGFAHLFEHLLFLESENLGKGGLDKLSARVGGSGANGSTSRDRTNYYQTVPKDALEKMLWAEADKLGWFINTVTDPVLAKEKQVVKNEKRQSIDNRPYGHTSYVIDKHLYPEDHPYNWQVIGSLEDLQNANVEDVKEFFKRWYVPNNVTLTVSGDFDIAQTKEWIEKYFGEIPRGENINPLPKRRGKVEQIQLLYHEDNFARVPELNLAWPTVEQYHPDAYPLTILAQYLSVGKKAPFNKVLVEDNKLASSLFLFQRASELAGQFRLTVRGYSSTDLDSVKAGIDEAFAKFEAEGMSESDLARIKAVLETRFYQGLSSVLGKGFQLAQYNIFAGDPGFIKKDIQNILDVSITDVMRVYKTYIKEKNYVATSFVPRGKLDLALSGSVKAEVVEETIVQGAEENFDASATAEYEKTPSSFDRSQEPPYGPQPEVKVPAIYQSEWANGLKVYGIENSEVPLVQLTLILDGGHALENLDKAGTANLLANTLTKGTEDKTSAELEEAIAQLGARIDVRAGNKEIRLSLSCLTKNFEDSWALVEEILLRPRWDEKEFDLAKQLVLSRIQQEKANPNAIARDAFNYLMYGKEDIRATSLLGSLETTGNLQLEDLKEFYSKYFTPQLARLHVVGDVKEQQLSQILQPLSEKWQKRQLKLPLLPAAKEPKEAAVYFYDVPNAKQSVLFIGGPSLPVSHPDHYPSVVMNYILGGGGFASQLTQQLREGKGYTYGIRSNFSGDDEEGQFLISSSVRSNVTLESTQLIKEIVRTYGKNFSEKDLETTQGFLLKSNARAFETATAKLSILENLSSYGWEEGYVKEREDIVRKMSISRIQELAANHLQADKMYWLVVGDAQTQFGRMKQLGYGDPVLLNDLLDKGL